MAEFGYPYIECDTHHRQLGYAVCVHVARHEAPPALIERASPTDLGTVLCQICTSRGEDLNGDDVDVLCSMCVEACGWIAELT